MHRIFSLCDAMSNSEVNPCHTCSTETKHRQVSIRWHGRGNYKYRPNYRHDGRILNEGGMFWEIDGICAFSISIYQTYHRISSLCFACICHILHGSTMDSQSKSIFALFVFQVVTQSLVQPTSSRTLPPKQKRSNVSPGGGGEERVLLRYRQSQQQIVIVNQFRCRSKMISRWW